MTSPSVAIVTGAASGIGQATARQLRAAGFLVAGIDRAPISDVDLALSADVVDAAAMSEAVRLASQELGPISSAVSVAGHYESGAFTEVSDDAVHRMLQVHLGGFINLSRAVLPGMIAAKHGSIVAITSELAVGGGDRDSHYSAAKGAVIGAVRSLAAEVAPAGVRVNGVAPGPTDTPLLAANSPWRDPAFLASLPAQRLATPEEVAACIRFLITAGGFCTGEILHPNSGAVI